MNDDDYPFSNYPLEGRPGSYRDHDYWLRRFRRKKGIRYALDRTIDWILIALVFPYAVVKGVIVGISELFRDKRRK